MKTNRFARLLSMLLCCCMILGMFPVSAFATEDDSAVVAGHEHTGGTATCETQAVCGECGEAYGELAAHTPSEDGTVCTVCGSTLVEKHTHTGGTATCKEQAKCGECGEAYGELAAHTPSEDGTVCTVCNTALVEKHTHTGGTATCKEQAKCDECGEAYGELAAHTPSEDGTVCTVCNTALVEEHTHTGGTATCKEQAKCDECGEAYGEFADHIPAEDDGDCTTEVVCTVCSAVTTEAAEMHTASADGTVCTICGAELPEIQSEDGAVFGDGYYKIQSEKGWTLAPGITETELVLNNEAGDRRQVLHIMEADMSNPYTKVTTSYTEMNTKKYAVSNMLDQANWVRDNWGWNVVGAMNCCLSWYNTPAYSQDPSRVNEPLGFMMIDSEIYFDHSVGFPTVLVIHKDTNAAGEARPADIPKVQMRTVNSSDDLNGWEDQVIPTSSGFIVKDGKNQYTESRTGSEPRSVVGIKPDGTVVVMMIDGRQSPYSLGMNMYELADVMIQLGCSYAVNCDGGGSSTFVTQRPGKTGLEVNCSPSDGSLRNNTSGILFVSTAPSDGAFNSAYISSEYDYYVPNSRVELKATGLDYSGASAEIPAEAVWALSDDAFGTVANGVFTSNGKTGSVDVKMLYNDKVVGSKTLNIVNPDTVAFAQTETVIPYGKTIPLDIKATYGVFDVSFDATAFEWKLSNTTAGSLDGLNYTAASDTAISGVVISATYKYADLGTFELKVSYGQGSEVLYDFEDKDISVWLGIDDTVAWAKQNNPQSPILDDKPLGANLSMENDVTTFLATAENGKVKNGEYALGVELDYTHSGGFGQWSYTMIANVEGQTVLRDIANGKNATRLGMWIYIPEELAPGHNMAMQTELYVGSSADSISRKNTHLILASNGKTLTKCTEADIPEDRWVYCYMDLTPYNYVSLQNPYTSTAQRREPQFMRFYTQSPEPFNAVLYIDDITLDYSDAVDDRDAPIIKDLQISVEGTAIRSFAAKVSDFTASNASGLNTASARVYVDGVAVTGVECNGSTISAPATTLSAGSHTVTFEIADNLGNVTKETQSFTVEGTAPVTVTGHNDLGKTPEYDSVYYVDIKTENIGTIENLSADIYLNFANTWELDHMIVANGFTATYSLDQYSNVATINVTNVDNVAVGAATLVSIPVRIWSWDAAAAGYESSQISANSYPKVIVKVDIRKGAVSFADGSTGTFNGNFNVDTALLASVTPSGWHNHNPKPLDEKTATCTAGGYSGRTYCEGCGSVIAWGTTIAATGHNWQINAEGKLACANNPEELFTGTYEGKDYVDGVTITDGWVEVDGVKTAYYKDGAKLTGSHMIDGVMCTFDENGAYLSDYKYEGFYEVGDTVMYFLNNKYTVGYARINRLPYYFDENGLGYNGEYILNGETCTFDNGTFADSENAAVVEAGWTGDQVEYVVYSDGRLVVTGEGNMWNYSMKELIAPWSNYSQNHVKSIYIGKGITHVGAYAFRNCFGATTVTFEEGSSAQRISNGAFSNIRRMTSITIPDSVRFINSGVFESCFKLTSVYLPDAIADIHPKAFVKCPEELVLSVDEGSYAETFAKENGISYTTRVHEVKNGIYNENGAIYYYKNDVKNAAGLVMVDGYYYYASTNGVCKTGKYWVSRTNDLLPAGYYFFDEETGRMEIKNGVYAEDGGIYYYVNDVRTGAGLVKVGDAYYYASTGGVCKTGKYWVSRTNDLLPAGFYFFDEVTAKMIIKNGIYAEDGGIYYYVDGVATGAGLVKVDGYYYYASTGGACKTGKYWVSRTNDLLPAGYYYFDEVTGRMDIKNGVYAENGGYYYYLDGVATGAGLVEVDGDYYYASTGGVCKTGKYWVSRPNGLMDAGYYTFGEDGKMIR